MGSLLAPALNVAILVAVLTYYLRKPAKDFVSSRHTRIEADLRETRLLLTQAREKFEDFSSKLKNIEFEVTSLREQSRRDAEALRSRIVNQSKQNAGSMVADAKANALGMFEGLKDEMRVDLALRVLAKVETILKSRLTQDDRQRIAREFSNQVERSA